jgi:flagellin
MSMVISTNLSALNTTNQLNKNTTLMNSSLQKLSSGYSINSASDNSAGLAISEKMRSQIQGLDQASSNSQDATSLTQTADGALDETTTILKRMRELAVEASSETLTDDDRTSVQDETNSLRQEIDRISNDTEYNTKKLLNGDSGSATSVSGTNSAAINATLTTAGNNTATGTYTVDYTSVATQATTGLTTSNTGITASTASATSFAGDVSINGTTITIASGDTIDGVLKKINAETGTTGVTASLDTTTTSGNDFIKLTDSTYGSTSSITLKAANSTLTGLFNATTDTTATSVATSGTDASGTINGAAATASGNTLSAFDLTVTGNDSTLTALTSTTAYKSLQSAVTTANTNLSTAITATTETTAEGTFAAAITTATGTPASAVKTAVTNTYAAYTAALTSGNAATITSTKASLTSAIGTLGNATLTTALGDYNTASGTAITTAAAAVTSAKSALTAADPTATVTVDATNALTFQVGANSDQTMSLSIGDIDANALGVAGSTSTTGIDLSSSTSATAAITTIDAAIKKVSAERSNLGAIQNSLDSNITNLDTESENLTSAESNIRDTDMATEMATYTKLSVITQAATAMLAKANSQPQKVLTLLQQ